MADYQYVADDETLATAMRGFSQAKAVALDTEFMRVNTYYPRVALMQIYDGETCCLIDPLTVKDLSPLIDLLGNPGILKVLHSCSEDMEIFQHSLGMLPHNVIDTQIAAAALGVGFTISYQALVEHYLGMTLPKDETRSDWLKRPLSASQLDYAARDVIHLLEVWHRQEAELADTPKAEWVVAESSGLGKNMRTFGPAEETYLKVNGFKYLDRRQLNVLQTLCTWREEKARKENLPRYWIVNDKSLLAIVRENLTGKGGLRSVAGMTAGQIKKYADEIFFQQTRARQMPEAECPEPLTSKGGPVDKNLMKRLKAVVTERAEALKVAPELLAKRRHLEQLLSSTDGQGNFQLPAALTGWRESVIGEPLLAALAVESKL